VVESDRLEPRQPVAATGLPGRISNWSLTSLQRLVKTGGRLAKHARYYWLLLAESHLAAVCRYAAEITALPVPNGIAGCWIAA
jgi:hypothetical protein